MKAKNVNWVLTNVTMLDTAMSASDSAKAIVTSDRTIDVLNEQLILQWGLGVTSNSRCTTTCWRRPSAASITFENPQEPWLLGIPDAEGFVANNWIRSGTQEGDDSKSPYELTYDDLMDEEELYEGFLGGTWAPYSVVSYTECDVEDPANRATYEYLPLYAPNARRPRSVCSNGTPESTTSVDVVFTSDRDLWTRCPVLEMQPNDILARLRHRASDDDVEKMNLRRHKSVDKFGRTVDDADVNVNDATLVSGTGMGWFPGYAIDVNTGERLNMAFGEDSWLSADNGSDMIFNPSTSREYLGGQHWIYVFQSGQSVPNGAASRMPPYDDGKFMVDLLIDGGTSNERKVFRDCAWVGSSRSNPDYPMLSVEDGLIPNEARVSLRVARPYFQYSANVIDTDNVDNAENNWDPLYTFSTGDRGHAIGRDRHFGRCSRKSTWCPTRTTPTANTRPTSWTTA